MSGSLIAATVVMLVAAALILALSWQNLYLVSALAIFPALVFLVNRPELWLALVIAISQSMLKFPQAPANLSAFHIFSLGLALFMIPYRMLHPSAHRVSPVRKYVLWFGLVLLITAAVRGAGIRAVGSDLWGGAAYVILLIAVVIFRSADLLDVSTRIWRNALVAMCLLSAIPTIAQILYVFTGISEQYYFIQPIGLIEGTKLAYDAGSGMARFNVVVGATLVWLPFIFFEHPFQRSKAITTIFFIGLALVSAAISGFRSSLISALLFVTICSTLEAKGINYRRGFLLAGALGFALLLAVVFARHLPLIAQRSLSFIPSPTIAWEAKQDAMSTTNWRLEVWARAIHDVPEYLLLGQGLAFNPRELMSSIAAGSYTRDWAFVTHSYHNGPLSLLLVLGLPGFLVGVGFVFSSLREYLRLMHEPWPDPLLGRLFRLVFAQFVTQCITFGTIYGDIQTTFPMFFFQAMLLEGLAKTRETMERAPVEELSEARPAKGPVRRIQPWRVPSVLPPHPSGL